MHSTMDGFRLRTLAVFCVSFVCVNLIAPPLSLRRITVGSSVPVPVQCFWPPRSVSHKYGSGSGYGSFPFLISVELTEIMVKKHLKIWKNLGILKVTLILVQIRNTGWQLSPTGNYRVVFNSLMTRGLEPSSLCGYLYIIIHIENSYMYLS